LAPLALMTVLALLLERTQRQRAQALLSRRDL
jgi:hypothetical protein